MMRISIHPADTFARAGGIDEGFAMLARNGIEGIQFGMGAVLMPATAVRGHKPSVMDEPLEKILEVVRPYKEAAERHNVAISQVHAPFPMYMYQDDELVERMKPIMKKSIAVTEYMNCPHVIIHPAYTFYNRDRFDAEAEWELNKELFGALIPDLKEHHVMALLENMFCRDAEGVRFAAVCSDFGEAATWLDRLNDMAGEELFGFNFDTGHCQLARQNVYRAVKLLGSHLKALHIQDNGGHLDDHRGPYTGILDWDTFLRALKEIGYQGDLNFEAGNAINKFPVELTEDCLHLLARTGWYFRKRLMED